MKNAYIFLALIALVVFGTSCKDSDSIEGTWELVKGTYITEDNTLNYPVSPGEVRMKVLTKTHFATVFQHPTNDLYSGYNGGEYEFKDGILTEYLHFFSDLKLLGKESHFLVRFEGDHVFMTACDKDGQVLEYGFFEEWKIIE